MAYDPYLSRLPSVICFFSLVISLPYSILAVDSSKPTGDALESRWGQASLLLSDNTLLVYGGKVTGSGGYTYGSSPNTDDLLSLSLNDTFSISSPPWRYLAGSQLSSTSSQSVSYATLGSLVEPTATNPGMILSFGGDVSSSPNLTSTDSSWIINLPQSDPNLTPPIAVKIGHQDPSWAQQPMRRMRHTMNSASNPNSLRLWVLGGQKDDGSQTVLNELWQYAAPKSAPLQGTWSQCSPAPLPTFDHASVAIVDPSNHVRIYALGGLGSDNKALDLSKIYRFTPDLSSDSCNGSWETLSLSSSSVPLPRRGHSIVILSSTQILLHGGASANGESVYADVWLLDLSTMSWGQLNAGNQISSASRWGHTMVRVGTNVVVAFGYGTLDASRPAPTSLGVFNLQNFQWSDTYSLSPSFGSRSNFFSSAVASPDSGVPDQHDWQVPGSSDAIKPLQVPSNPVQPSHPSSSTAKILGISFGIFGALIVVAGSLAAYRYQKRVKEKRLMEASAYKQKAYGPDFNEGNPDNYDDKTGLIDQGNSLHASHTIPRTRGHVGRFDHATPNPLKALAGVGVGVRALWPVKRLDKNKERFDILADEESDVWVCSDDASLIIDNPSSPHSTFDRAKALKKYVDGCAERVRLPPPPPSPAWEATQQLPSLVTTRGGLRIWDGLDDPADSQGGGFGTSTSFLGASLAPWSDDGRCPSLVSEYGRQECLRDPFNNTHAIDSSQSTEPIDFRRRSWDTHSRHDSLLDAYQDQDAHHREGTIHSTSDVGDSTREAQPMLVARDVFDEVEVVYDIGLSAAALSNQSLVSNAGNPLLTSCSPPKNLERRTTWWDRLRHGSDKHGVVDLAPGAIHPIRDPTPAPPIPPINVDQFNDSNMSEQYREFEPPKPDYRADEYGRYRAAAIQSASHPNDVPTKSTKSSQSSHRSAATATSSMLDAATAHMTVIHRLRTTDSSLLSDSSSNRRRHLAHDSTLNIATPSTSATAEEQEPLTPVTSRMASSPRPQGPRIHSPDLTPRNTSSLFSVAEPPTRPEQIQVTRPLVTRKQTAGSVGVRAMVKQFETPPLVRKESVEPQNKRVSQRVKVEHSLVKKPLLYVANPDK